MPKASPSKRPAAQVAFAKAAYAKAAMAKTRAVTPELIEANEQELAEAVLTDSNRLAREHNERRVHAARGPPGWLGDYLVSKRDVLAITNVTFPTLWAWMRAGKFPRARVVGAKSMWLSSEIEAWLATLPVRRLKDAPEAPVSEQPAGVELSRSCLRGSASS